MGPKCVTVMCTINRVSEYVLVEAQILNNWSIDPVYLLIDQSIHQYTVHSLICSSLINGLK